MIIKKKKRERRKDRDLAPGKTKIGFDVQH